MKRTYRAGDRGKVLVFEPHLDEAIEDGTGYNGLRGQSAVRSAGVVAARLERGFAGRREGESRGRVSDRSSGKTDDGEESGEHDELQLHGLLAQSSISHSLLLILPARIARRANPVVCI